MENRINNRDFEQFVKQNADQYRMFPSEKVWVGIHNRLHGSRRWIVAGIALLLLSVGTVTLVTLTNNAGQNKSDKIAAKTETTKPEKIVQGSEKQSPITVLVPAKEKNNQPVSAKRKRLNQVKIVTSPEPIAIAYTPIENPATEEPASTENSEEITSGNTDISINATNEIIAAQPEAQQINKETQTTIPVTTSELTPEPVAATKEEIINPAEHSVFSGNELMTIESVVNSYIKIRKKERSSLQLYFAPLVTLRTLNENKTFISSSRNITNTASGTQYVYYMPDLKNVVTHKPDIGFNLGIVAGIPVTKNFRLLSGFQFNVNKYEIRAYQHTNEVARVSLSNDNGGTNTVYPVTSYRIVGGYNTKWLRNYYFSASLPIGAEIKFVNNKKTSFGIAGTVQPTYVLDNRSYLISTDYKNYVEIPSLTRRWNINTGFEMFAGVKAGKTELRISPQVRYQTLSSYKDSYPVKENLFDFGLKLGVMLK